MYGRTCNMQYIHITMWHYCFHTHAHAVNGQFVCLPLVLYFFSTFLRSCTLYSVQCTLRLIVSFNISLHFSPIWFHIVTEDRELFEIHWCIRPLSNIFFLLSIYNKITIIKMKLTLSYAAGSSKHQTSTFNQRQFNKHRSSGGQWAVIKIW